MLPFFLTVLCIALIFVGIHFHRKTGQECFDMLAFACVILLMLHSIAWLCFGIVTVASNGRLMADQKNLVIFKETVKTINVLATIKEPVDSKLIGGLENMKQSSNASQTLVEYRDRVVAYNESIALRKVMRSNFLLRYYVVALPKDIEMMDLNLDN